MPKEYYEKYYLPEYHPYLPRNCWPAVGCDIGLTNDFTVITAMDMNTNKQIFYWRFCPGDAKGWGLNYDALLWAWNYFQVPLRVDCTGFGSHIPGEMSKRGVPLQEWGGGIDKMKFTDATKSQVMENLSSLIGGKNIELFDITVIKQELKDMQRTIRDSGGFRIAAEKNKHDDIPISLGLACIGVRPLLITHAHNTQAVIPGKKSVFMTEEW